MNADFRPDIEGLRGLAILLVVVCHAFPTALAGGYLGVDLFFVISGYLITRLLWPDLAKGEFHAGQFYARRALRLLPTLAIVLASTLLLGLWLLGDEEFKRLGVHAVAAGLFSNNLVLNAEAGYFDQLSSSKPLLHLWSLSIEEQFYLAFPWLLLAASRSEFLQMERRRRLRFAVAGLGLVSGAFYFAVATSQPSYAFFMLPTRAWELCAGAALAAYAVNVSSARVRCWMSFAGLVGIGLLSLIARDGQPIATCLAVVCAGLLIVGRDNAGRSSAIVTSRLMRWLGRVSYAWYLWHWPLLVYVGIWGKAHDLTPTEHATVVMGVVLLSLGLAVVSTYLVELPVRKVISRQRVMQVAMGFVMGVSPGLFAASAGNPLDESTVKVDEKRWREEGLWGSPECVRGTGVTTDPGPDKAWPRVFCGGRVGADVLVLGDSHANHLYPGLNEQLGAKGLKVHQIGYTVCPSIEGVRSTQRGEKDNCKTFNDQMLAYAAASTASTILLTARWPLYVDGTAFGPVYGHDWRLGEADDTRTNEQIATQGLIRTLKLLQRPGRRVVLVLSVPELDFVPSECLGKHAVVRDRSGSPLRMNGRPCSMDRAVVDHRQAGIRRVFESVRHLTGVEIWDPLAAMCTELSCKVVDDVGLLYRDGTHLSVHGSMVISDYLIKRYWARFIG